MKFVVLSITFGLALSLTALADEPPALEAPSFTLPSIEEKYASEASKADAVVAKAETEAAKTKKLAADARLKAYKDKLVEITKTGDFDKAQQVKARIQQLEKEQEHTGETAPNKNSNSIKILSATYGVNQSIIDVTDKLGAMISKRKESEPLIVSNELFGDPVPNFQIGNTLIVRFQRNREIKTVAVYAGRPLILR